MSSPAPRSGPFAALGNAFYLGTSWTWVIGMLFPALILRDYGLWGFVAFAVPNVVGAAAMGFVLTPERAKGILERHKTAIKWFSTITIAFHVFVAAWLLPSLIGKWPTLIALGLSLNLCPWANRRWGAKGRWIVSAAVWMLSMAMFALAAQQSEAWNVCSWHVGRLGGHGVLAFVPASLLGFSLCPYLDLTFLKARAETDKNTGRAAFALGFGLVFCAMIFFTACYAGVLLPYLEETTKSFVPGIWSWIFFAHLPIQIGLTVSWHFDEEPHQETKITRHGCLAGLIIVLALFLGLFPGRTMNGSLGEVDYRSFLLLYGTVLPAYVLLKMIPTRQPVSARFRTVVFVCASLVSYPLAWGAFVLMHHWLILPCAAVLAIAFLAVQFGPKEKGEAQADAPAFKPEA